MCSRALIGDSALEPMLGAIVERVAEVLGAGACAILLPDGEQLVVRAGIGPLPDPADRDDATLARWAFEHRFAFTLPVEREPAPREAVR